jgi:hypothetical protein
MPTICWTIIHHAVTPAAHGATRLSRVARRFVAPVVNRRAGHVVLHAPRVAAQPRTWIQLVCKTIPAVVGGGGLLIPQPANPPRLPEPPPAIVSRGPAFTAWPLPVISDPGPPLFSWSPVNGAVPPDEPGPLNARPVPEAAPEPSSAGLLVGSLFGLLLTRSIIRHGAA